MIVSIFGEDDDTTVFSTDVRLVDHSNEQPAINDAGDWQNFLFQHCWRSRCIQLAKMSVEDEVSVVAHNGACFSLCHPKRDLSTSSLHHYESSDCARQHTILYIAECDIERGHTRGCSDPLIFVGGVLPPSVILKFQNKTPPKEKTTTKNKTKPPKKSSVDAGS